MTASKLRELGYERVGGTPPGSVLFERATPTGSDAIAFGTGLAGHRVSKSSVQDAWSGDTQLTPAEVVACAEFCEEMGWACG